MLDVFGEFLLKALMWGSIFAIPVVPLVILNKMDNKSEKLLRNCGIVNKDGKHPKLIRQDTKDYGYDLIFSLQAGICLEDFKRQQKEIEQYLDGEVQFEYWNKMVILKVMTGKLADKYDYAYRKLYGTEILVGMSRNGVISLKLDDENPHLLIAGMTGSGKSMLLRAIIVNLILSANRMIKLHLADLKAGAEFGIYERSSAVTTFSKDIADTLELLQMFDNEMMKRFNLFQQAGVVNIYEYNKIDGPLPYHLLIIDEFANIVEEDKDCLYYLKRLLRMARACGIHIILCTQRPDAQTVPGSIKNNVGARIALYCADPTNSRIIIDSDKAASLTGNGHGILHTKGDIEFRGFYLDTEKAKRLIKHTLRNVENKVKDDTSGVVSIDDYTKGPADN
jgi:S-DNA-T family DNA segregation ATPase FtsK/SpoIIIE